MGCLFWFWWNGILLPATSLATEFHLIPIVPPFFAVFHGEPAAGTCLDLFRFHSVLRLSINDRHRDRVGSVFSRDHNLFGK